MTINNYYLIVGNLKINKNLCLIHNYKIYKKKKHYYEKLSNNFLLRKTKNNYQFLNLLIINDNNYYLDVLKLNIDNNNNINIILKKIFLENINRNIDIKILLFYDKYRIDIFNNYIWSKEAYNLLNEIKRKNKILKMFYKIDIKRYNNILRINDTKEVELNEINELKILLNDNNIKNIISRKINLNTDLNNYDNIKDFLEKNNLIFSKIK